MRKLFEAFIDQAEKSWVVIAALCMGLVLGAAYAVFMLQLMQSPLVDWM